MFGVIDYTFLYIKTSKLVIFVVMMSNLVALFNHSWFLFLIVDLGLIKQAFLFFSFLERINLVVLVDLLMLRLSWSGTKKPRNSKC